MEPISAVRPLLSWEGVTLRVDLAQLHAWLNRELPRRAPALRRVELQGLPEGDLLLSLGVVWKGLPATLSVRLREVKVLHGFFGCQVVGVRGPLGVPVPTTTAAGLLARLWPGKVQYDGRDGVFLFDLREWLPAGLEVSIRHVRCGAHLLELGLGHGWLCPPAPALGAGGEGEG